MWDLRLYVVQRITAALMVPLILVHLAIIFYATRSGISAESILARTSGNAGWAMYYGLFVVLAAMHGAIGVRSVVREWTQLRGPALDTTMFVVGGILLTLGARAVIAVVAPGGSPV